MSAIQSRVNKRMHQACEACRRKKTRCPGEKPACSTCTRLSQLCSYTDSSTNPAHMENNQGNSGNWESRLAQLEERMEREIEKRVYHSVSLTRTNKSMESIGSTSSALTSQLSIETPRNESFTSSSAMPPKEALLDAVNVYFRYCHMQPLWLFDLNDLSHIETCCEEIIFSLLALSVCHSTHSYFRGRAEQLTRRYAQLARERIMFTISQGSIKLSTLQSLCMLILTNFLTNDVHLTSLHVSIARGLSSSAGLDFDSNPSERSSSAEARRRVFWSLHLLDQIYGQRSMTIDLLQDLEDPRYVLFYPDLRRKLSVLPPSMPQEVAPGTWIQQNEIWAYMVQLSALWREVRRYLEQCAHTNSEPPWSVNSGYSLIGAHLMDLETKLPTCHRWGSARFSDHSKEELQHNRGYWSPWLYLQFTYHTVHCVLNHPFLYSSRPQQPTQLAVPNTFWKTSSDLAFVHATWVVRLIEMVLDKTYWVSDPFIGHCVGIAATVLLYFCRTIENKTREAAQIKLAKCVAFLGELALIWPACKLMHEKLQLLIHSAFESDGSAMQHDSSRRTISINTGLMWKILRHNFAGNEAYSPGQGLFHESFRCDANNENNEDPTVETQIFHNPTTEADISDGGQALPPCSGRATMEKSPQRAGGRGRRDQHASSSNTDAHSALYRPLPEVLNTSWEYPGNNTVMNTGHDPFFQFQHPGTPYSGTWEFGNL